MKKVSIDIAERYEPDLRRRLRSADRLSDTAILRGLDFVKTPFSSVSALLSRVTRPDHRLPRRFDRLDAVLRPAMFSNAVSMRGVPRLAWVWHAAKLERKTAIDRLDFCR
jgi:hypothetical protein